VRTSVPFATPVTRPFGSTVATAVLELDQFAVTCSRVLPLPYDPPTLSYAASCSVPPGAAMVEAAPTACTTSICPLLEGEEEPPQATRKIRRSRRIGHLTA